MKTTLEIPDALFRRAKSVAAERGIPLREFVTEAVKDKLAANARAEEKPWVKHMGKLKYLHKETERISRLVEEDSEKIDAEMWR
jgi:metal-responsive CopG/Arc/MetJ family transcriptional regulator